jgi:hypothetical protein
MWYKKFTAKAKKGISCNAFSFLLRPSTFSPLRLIFFLIFNRVSLLAQRMLIYGVAGVELRWAILDHYPADVAEELVKSGYGTASPWVNDFDEADRGRKVYYSRSTQKHLGPVHTREIRPKIAFF